MLDVLGPRIPWKRQFLGIIVLAVVQDFLYQQQGLWLECAESYFQGKACPVIKISSTLKPSPCANSVVLELHSLACSVWRVLSLDYPETL